MKYISGSGKMKYSKNVKQKFSDSNENISSQSQNSKLCTVCKISKFNFLVTFNKIFQKKKAMLMALC